MTTPTTIGLHRIKLPKIELPSVILPKIFGSGDDSDYEIVEGEPYLTLEGDANNLVLNSGSGMSSNMHPIKSYTLYNSDLLAKGVKVTFSLWGQLGQDSSEWNICNGDTASNICRLLKSEEKDGMWTKQTTWRLNYLNGENGLLQVYTSTTSTPRYPSRIDRIKLELGWNDNPVWTPAPSEVSGDKKDAILLENGGKIILEQNKMRVFARSKR